MSQDLPCVSDFVSLGDNADYQEHEDEFDLTEHKVPDDVDVDVNTAVQPMTNHEREVYELPKQQIEVIERWASDRLKNNREIDSTEPVRPDLALLDRLKQQGFVVPNAEAILQQLSKR